jgi:hypothetical protein
MYAHTYIYIYIYACDMPRPNKKILALSANCQNKTGKEDAGNFFCSTLLFVSARF